MAEHAPLKPEGVESDTYSPPLHIGADVPAADGGEAQVIPDDEGHSVGDNVNNGKGDVLDTGKDDDTKKDVKIKVVLLDIEGTVCSISFVKEILFPYFLKRLPPELKTHWKSPFLQPFIEKFPEEHRGSPEAIIELCEDLVRRDVKEPAMKELQGLIWQNGYFGGELKCPLFDDVVPCIEKWTKAGLKVVIYSSGSVKAQKLLFQYSTSKTSPITDVRRFISDYFDTQNAGPKTVSDSYEKIYQTVSEPGVKKEEWLFLSDNTLEVEAALKAGMTSALVIREGNPPLPESDLGRFIEVRDFNELAMPDAGLLRDGSREKTPTDKDSGKDQTDAAWLETPPHIRSALDAVAAEAVSPVRQTPQDYANAMKMQIKGKLAFEKNLSELAKKRKSTEEVDGEPQEKKSKTEGFESEAEPGFFDGKAKKDENESLDQGTKEAITEKGVLPENTAVKDFGVLKK